MDETKASEVDMVKFLHRAIADIHEILDPRAATPYMNAVEARAKAAAALKVAADFGVLS